MERALQFGTVLALAWVGQGLLPTHPLAGLAVLGAALAALIWLPRLAAHAQSLGRTSGVASAGRPHEKAGRLSSRALRAIWLIGAAAGCGAAAYVVDAIPAMQPWPALLVWASAIGLLLAGAWQLTAPQRSMPATQFPEFRQFPRTGTSGSHGIEGARIGDTAAESQLAWARWEVAAVLGITVLAFALRAAALDRIPLNFGGDEGEMGMAARAVLRGVVRDPFATGWLSHPNLWFFLQALALRLFGDTIVGLRLLSAMIGTATIAALYLFARPLYGRPAALIATALLAAYHFHIHFSRLGVNNIVDPLAALIVFAAFLHGYRTRSPFSFALAGVALGLAQHFYMGARLTPLIIAAALLHQLILDRRKLWSLRWQIGLMALGFLLGIGPLLGFFVTHPRDFTARLAMVGAFQSGWFDQQRARGMSVAQIALDQARNSFGAWTWQPDRGAYYDPQMPLLDRVSSILFLLGLGITVTNWRRMDAAILLAWMIGVAVLGGMLMDVTPESPRYLISVPVVCLFIALAIVELGVVLRRFTPIGQRGVWGLMAVGVVLLALWSVNFYFREYTPRNRYGWANTTISTAIGRYLHDQGDPVFVYFFGAPAMYYTHGAIRFQAPETPGKDIRQPLASTDALPALPARHRPIFIFLHNRLSELAVVQARYPNGIIEELTAGSGAPLATIYAVKQ